MKVFSTRIYFASIIILALLLQGCKEEKEPVVSPKLIVTDLYVHIVNSLEVKVVIAHYGSKSVKEHGIVWSENPNPTIENNKFVYAGGKPTSYSYTIKGLQLNTTYYVRAYLINENNEITYTEDVLQKTSIHKLISFIPSSASPDMKVTIRGENFDPSTTELYIDNIKIDAQIESTSDILFTVPFGLDTDSVSIGVEINGTRVVFPKKLQYKKGRWTQMKSILDNPQSRLSYIVGLQIGGKGYATGTPPVGNNNIIYEYDPVTDNWSELTVFPELTRLIRWFPINQQIYSISEDKFWMFDTLAGQWYDLEPCPYSLFQPFLGISFAFGGSGYYGLGKIDSTKDLWKYNPPLRSWIKVSDYPGGGTLASLAVTTINYAYIIGGFNIVNDNRQYFHDNWQYDPDTNAWKKMTDYPGKGYYALNGFTFNDKLYVGGGIDQDGTHYKDFWEYDPTTDRWTAVSDFPWDAAYMFSFTTGGNVYVGGGNSTRYSGGSSFHELWLFDIK